MRHMFAFFGVVKNTSCAITNPQLELTVLVSTYLLKLRCILRDRPMMRNEIYDSSYSIVY